MTYENFNTIIELSDNLDISIYNYLLAFPTERKLVLSGLIQDDLLYREIASSEDMINKLSETCVINSDLIYIKKSAPQKARMFLEKSIADIISCNTDISNSFQTEIINLFIEKILSLDIKVTDPDKIKSVLPFYLHIDKNQDTWKKIVADLITSKLKVNDDVTDCFDSLEEIEKPAKQSHMLSDFFILQVSDGKVIISPSYFERPLSILLFHIMALIDRAFSPVSLRCILLYSLLP